MESKLDPRRVGAFVGAAHLLLLWFNKAALRRFAVHGYEARHAKRRM